MAKLHPRKIGLLVVVAATVIVAGIAGWIAWKSASTKQVVIAAGSSKGEGFVLLQALKVVAERNYPHLKVTVLETRDADESLRKLANGEAQFAATQADADAGQDARVVAVLFDDIIQVLANPGTGIQRFVDLKGKKVALAKKGAQFQSFLFVAQYFGLGPEDVQFVGEDDEAADVAFASNSADAIFRVRAVHDPALTQVAGERGIRFVPIDEGRGIHMQRPAYSPTVIPKATYLGTPPVPASDIPTIAIRHTLLARQDLDGSVVQAITDVLMNHRAEMGLAFPPERADLLPLLAEIRQPTEAMGLGLGVHPGARDEYERGKVPFIRAHADAVMALVGCFALAGFWVWALHLLHRRRQGDRLAKYIEHLHDLMSDIEIATTDRQAAPIRSELLRVLRAAIGDFEHDRISARNLHSFEVIWRVAFAAARERRTAIRKFSGTAPLVDEPPRSQEWSFAKLLARFR